MTDRVPSTHRELVEAGATELRSARGDARRDPRREASRLLQEAVGVDRARLLARAEETVPGPDADLYWELVRRRAEGEPLQLLVGETEFHEVRLGVEAGVFIPRPETELLVEEGRRAIRERLAATGGRAVTVLDLCTGTGAVALALAAAMRDRADVRVLAGDWSPQAVRLARRNAARLDLRSRVEVRRSDLFSAFADVEGTVDVLLANPPYIAPSEGPSLPIEVQRGDPAQALFDPDGGTGFHRRIARRGMDFVRPGGVVVLEMGETQGPTVAAILRERGWDEPTILRDLAGRERFARAIRPGG